MTSLLQTVMSTLTPNLAASFGDAVGASPTAITTGLGAAAPALLASSLQKSATAEGARSLLGLVRQATADGDPLNDLRVLAAEEQTRTAYLARGQSLASSLLDGGSGSQPVAAAVASHAGVGLGSATKLLALAAPLVLAAIGRAAGPSPTVGGLQSLLSGQRSDIMGALPAGIGALFGRGPRAATGRGAVSADEYAANAVFTDARGGQRPGATAAAAAAPGEGSRMGRIFPWLALGLLLIGLVFAIRNCGMARTPAPKAPQANLETRPSVPAVTTPAPPPVAAVPHAAAPGANVNLSLPGGAAIDVPRGSIGFDLANYLGSNEPAPRRFVFDNLNYETASATLSPASQATISAITAILKAYPNAQVRVVGYTDDRGDDAANRTLSERRAESVRSGLAQGGVPANRIEAAGLGEADPVASNATPDGRAANRRTELVVVRR